MIFFISSMYFEWFLYSSLFLAAMSMLEKDVQPVSFILLLYLSQNITFSLEEALNKSAAAKFISVLSQAKLGASFSKINRAV